MSWNQRLNQALLERKQQGLFRTRQRLASAQGVNIEASTSQLGSRTFTNFCSNDYLGLAHEGGEFLSQAAQKWALGSGASHLVCGHSDAHHELENALARLTGYPKALLFSTGYMANVGTLSALAKRGDLILQDKLNHASLLDGAMLSRAELKRFPHQDYSRLESLLQQRTTQGETLIVSDSIFSMDGDLADVPTLCRLANQHQALLMIDDAHGFGVLGKHGAGVREHFGLSHTDLPLYVGTLGKALGGYGAFVAGDESSIEYLIQFARPYIYTTAMPPALAEAMLGQLTLLADDTRRHILNQRIGEFKAGAQARSLPIMDSSSPIQPLLVGQSDTAVQISDSLMERGILVSAIRPPTVPQNQARLRITLTASHSSEQVQCLLDNLADIWQGLAT